MATLSAARNSGRLDRRRFAEGIKIAGPCRIISVLLLMLVKLFGDILLKFVLKLIVVPIVAAFVLASTFYECFLLHISAKKRDKIRIQNRCRHFTNKISTEQIKTNHKSLSCEQRRKKMRKKECRHKAKFKWIGGKTHTLDQVPSRETEAPPSSSSTNKATSFLYLRSCMYVCVLLFSDVPDYWKSFRLKRGMYLFFIYI